MEFDPYASDDLVGLAIAGLAALPPRQSRALLEAFTWDAFDLLVQALAPSADELFWLGEVKRLPRA